MAFLPLFPIIVLSSAVFSFMARTASAIAFGSPGGTTAPHSYSSISVLGAVTASAMNAMRYGVTEGLFKFNDANNCRRVYEAICRLL